MSIKTRKSNGQGHTYKVGNSWKTVITSQGLKILKKRFTDSIFVIRGQAVLIVKMLIGLGK